MVVFYIFYIKGKRMVEKILDELDVKLYYEDSYIEEFEAEVLSCEKVCDTYRIVLNCTAFFPEGGGQRADTGVLNGTVKVVDVQEQDGCIYHVTDGPLEVGSVVTGRIDFEKRFDKMQQHTAEHIVSGLIHNYFGLDNVGFHLGNDVVTMDFNGELSEEELRLVELKANEAVVDNVVIETRFPDKEELLKMDYRSKLELTGVVRIVIVPGYDVCACCAPHVGTTGEIGIIKLTGAEKYKGGMRVSMVCGFRALSDYNRKEKSIKELSVRFSAKPDEVVEAVKKLEDQLLNEKAKYARFMTSYVQEKLEDVKAEDRLAILCAEGLEANAMRNYVNKAMEITDGLCCAFSGTEEGYSYILGSKSLAVTDIAKKMNETFNGKGGGKPPMVQGSLKGRMEDVREFLMGYLN